MKPTLESFKQKYQHELDLGKDPETVTLNPIDGTEICRLYNLSWGWDEDHIQNLYGIEVVLSEEVKRGEAIFSGVKRKKYPGNG